MVGGVAWDGGRGCRCGGYKSTLYSNASFLSGSQTEISFAVVSEPMVSKYKRDMYKSAVWFKVSMKVTKEK